MPFSFAFATKSYLVVHFDNDHSWICLWIFDAWKQWKMLLWLLGDRSVMWTITALCVVSKKKDFGEQFPTMGYSDILDSWSSPNSSSWVAINFLYNTTKTLLSCLCNSCYRYILSMLKSTDWENDETIYIYKYIMNPFS